jgi:eukaryotic-like serine/threonine-protein kinase
MEKRVAILEPNDHDTLPHPSAAPARVAGRFQYASGDRPLAGYTIKRGVGQGGFGEIYYAQSDAGKDVALKLVRRNLEVELRGIRQCLNLKHPHLLDLYDIRQDDRGDTWVVMEYIADQSLEDVMAARPGGMTPEEALGWIHGIGAGVAYLHDRGIVHRDLKPGNIFCDEGVVKVGDYGLSKFISCSRRSGHTESIGTVHYMAPEVANGRYGKEIDVYAMGVILYELLTGRVPFEGESIGEVLMKHLTAKPDVSMLPEPYRGVVARAMEKDPALRFRSAAEMLSALPPSETKQTLFSHTAGIGRKNQDDNRHDTVVVASVVPEEPVLRALHERWQRFYCAWRERRSDSHMRQVVFVLIILAVFLHGPLFALAIASLPFVFMLVVLYGVYRLVWMSVQAISGRSSAVGKGMASASIAASPGASPPAPRGWRRFRGSEQAVPGWVPKSGRQRLAELLGSMLGSTLVAATMCVVMVLIESFRNDALALPRPEQIAWLLFVGVVGSWAVLIPSKFWEGFRGDAMVRRFLLMVIGMGVGVAAYALGELLMVGLPPAAGYPVPPGYRLPPSFYAQDGRPLLMAYVACFGTLFLLVRWWLQTDLLRRSRLGLWRLVVSVVVAAVAAWAWQFPQPWLPMIAATISVSVQLAGPWRRQDKRL